MCNRFIVRKYGLFLKSMPLDTAIVYKIINISNNRWFIRNGHIGFSTSIKDNIKKRHEILRITIPKFEQEFFKKNDIVMVETYGRIIDNKTIQVSQSTGDGITNIQQ